MFSGSPSVKDRFVASSKELNKQPQKPRLVKRKNKDGKIIHYLFRSRTRFWISSLVGKACISVSPKGILGKTTKSADLIIWFSSLCAWFPHYNFPLALINPRRPGNRRLKDWLTWSSLRHLFFDQVTSDALSVVCAPRLLELGLSTVDYRYYGKTGAIRRNHRTLI